MEENKQSLSLCSLYYSLLSCFIEAYIHQVHKELQMELWSQEVKSFLLQNLSQLRWESQKHRSGVSRREGNRKDLKPNRK